MRYGRTLKRVTSRIRNAAKASGSLKYGRSSKLAKEAIGTGWSTDTTLNDVKSLYSGIDMSKMSNRLVIGGAVGAGYGMLGEEKTPFSSAFTGAMTFGLGGGVLKIGSKIPGVKPAGRALKKLAGWGMAQPIKRPFMAGTAAIGALGAASFAKPIISNGVNKSMLNRPTNPSLGASTVGPGYTTIGNRPRVRMPYNNLGATGDVTLAMHRLRHGRK